MKSNWFKFNLKFTRQILDLEYLLTENNILHRGSLFKLPVLDCNLGGNQALPHGQLSAINHLDDICVSHHSFLFKVSYKSMAKLWADLKWQVLFEHHFGTGVYSEVLTH